QARKSRSGRSSAGSDTRSNASGRSRRSTRSHTRSSRSAPSSRAATTQPMEMAGGDDAGGDLPSQKWQSSICCAGGCKSLYGFCVPCAVATARNRIDGSSWCVNLLCLNVCAARSIIRHGYGIKGHCCADIMCSMLCTPCVACQLLGETEKRGPIHDHWREGANRANIEQPWKFGMFNCFDDCTTCGYACFCPMPAVGTIRTQMDESDWLFNCCCINPFIARSLVRRNYNIEVCAIYDI
ncbi:unnamed protein product, partial [Laminaria digitata]